MSDARRLHETLAMLQDAEAQVAELTEDVAEYHRRMLDQIHLVAEYREVLERIENTTDYTGASGTERIVADIARAALSPKGGTDE